VFRTVTSSYDAPVVGVPDLPLEVP
jgi:hypothetical protein